jgi:3',5'-cyclic AMP phosphodiesterase CpdA
MRGASRERNCRVGVDQEDRGYVLGREFESQLLEVAKEGVDLVCFTGDLADTGHPAEYRSATRRIKRILRTVNVPRYRFFAVPGNHDVQRAVYPEAWRALRGLPRTPDVQRQLGLWLRGSGGPPGGIERRARNRVLRRTASFWKGMEAFGRPGLGPTPPTFLGYRRTIPPAAFEHFSLPVHIIGLDSAWLCGDEYDRGSILLTEEQVQAHIRDGDRPLEGLRIALVHHPLTELADYPGIRRLLGADGVDLVLHGHQHSSSALDTREPDASLRTLGASCLVEGDRGRQWANGFQLVEVFPSLDMRVHFRKWEKDSKHWTIGSDYYRTDSCGCITWPRVRTDPFNAVEPPLCPGGPTQRAPQRPAGASDVLEAQMEDYRKRYRTAIHDLREIYTQQKPLTERVVDRAKDLITSYVSQRRLKCDVQKRIRGLDDIRLEFRGKFYRHLSDWRKAADRERHAAKLENLLNDPFSEITDLVSVRCTGLFSTDYDIRDYLLRTFDPVETSPARKTSEFLRTPVVRLSLLLKPNCVPEQNVRDSLSIPFEVQLNAFSRYLLDEIGDALFNQSDSTFLSPRRFRAALLQLDDVCQRMQRGIDDLCGAARRGYSAILEDVRKGETRRLLSKPVTPATLKLYAIYEFAVRKSIAPNKVLQVPETPEQAKFERLWLHELSDALNASRRNVKIRDVQEIVRKGVPLVNTYAHKEHARKTLFKPNDLTDLLSKCVLLGDESLHSVYPILPETMAAIRSQGDS